KRRIIRPEALQEIRRVLVDGGSGIYVTDHRAYSAAAPPLLPEFFETELRVPGPDDPPRTNYAAKYRAEGRPISEARFRTVEQGANTTTRGAELADRLCRIHDPLVALIGRTAPEAVAVEAPFAGHNVKSLIQLAHARGVILLVARMAKLPVFEYSPRSVKSA